MSASTRSRQPGTANWALGLALDYERDLHKSDAVKARREVVGGVFGFPTAFVLGGKATLLAALRGGCGLEQPNDYRFALPNMGIGKSITLVGVDGNDIGVLSSTEDSDGMLVLVGGVRSCFFREERHQRPAASLLWFSSPIEVAVPPGCKMEPRALTVIVKRVIASKPRSSASTSAAAAAASSSSSSSSSSFSSSSSSSSSSSGAAVVAVAGPGDGGAARGSAPIVNYRDAVSAHIVYRATKYTGDKFDRAQVRRASKLPVEQAAAGQAAQAGSPGGGAAAAAAAAAAVFGVEAGSSSLDAAPAAQTAAAKRAAAYAAAEAAAAAAEGREDYLVALRLAHSEGERISQARHEHLKLEADQQAKADDKASKAANKAKRGVTKGAGRAAVGKQVTFTEIRSAAGPNFKGSCFRVMSGEARASLLRTI